VRVLVSSLPTILAVGKKVSRVKTRRNNSWILFKLFGGEKMRAPDPAMSYPTYLFVLFQRAKSAFAEFAEVMSPAVSRPSYDTKPSQTH
jgi:hypothetical protein